MKKIFLLLSILIIIPFFACKKSSITTTIFKNCTGTYLLIDGNTYKVCNTGKTAAFSGGETVKVKYKFIKECDNSDNEDCKCYLDSRYDGWIRIYEIHESY